MGPSGSKNEGPAGCRTRARDPGAEGNQRKSGACGEAAGHYPGHLAQTRRKIWHPTRVKHQMTAWFGSAERLRSATGKQVRQGSPFFARDQSVGAAERGRLAVRFAIRPFFAR